MYFRLRMRLFVYTLRLKRWQQRTNYSEPMTCFALGGMCLKMGLSCFKPCQTPSTNLFCYLSSALGALEAFAVVLRPNALCLFANCIGITTQAGAALHRAQWEWRFGCSSCCLCGHCFWTLPLLGVQIAVRARARANQFACCAQNVQPAS